MTDNVERAKERAAQEVRSADVQTDELLANEESAFAAGNYDGRLGKVEGQLESVATKEDLASLKNEISNAKLWAAILFAGVMTTLLGTSIGVNIALGRVIIGLLADIFSGG